ncbi:M1 family metallopeptidase [Cellulophaga baltica]|uniref:M1 family metallopeptidase n=1 Tax=Cellulophaga TaxID=104264 RepID=UPI001C068412|nr:MULTISPECIES: M1 family metallopeptidase [Cellulophaga]MBU2997455.1 M1 family metallopeptidase [Cellulophaga baltica]MDO6768852.1 M1 family metallopeptidase [Cellulophaga sp. 1_MG-2023]
MHYKIVLFIYLLSLSLTAQIQEKVDFTKATLNISVLPDSKEIKGNVTYNFKVLQAIDSIFLDAKNMTFTSVKLKNKNVTFKTNDEQIIIKKNLKKDKSYTLQLEYTAKPKQTVYFIGWDKNSTHNQVWTQGQGKYTSHWLPSFDDMNEKVEYDLNITFDKNYEVIANGKLTNKKTNDTSTTWFFDMEKPISSYLLAFAIGDYNAKVLESKSGIPIELYYYPNDSLNVEPTYRYTKKIFDFLEDEIGVAYPWQNYKQIPVKDFLYAGMENTTATIFSDGYMIDEDAFIDKNYVNVNAHELAHQWFGDLVTEVDGHHHWLQEGFATYYALLAEKEIFGEDYFYWKLYDTAQILQSNSENNKGEALTNDKASSLTFYEKGAWALVMLKNKVGAKAFKKRIKRYLEKYQFENVKISDFISEMEHASETDLSDFYSEWISGKQFPTEKVFEYLKNNSESIATYLSLQKNITGLETSIDSIKAIDTTFFNTTSTKLKKHILNTYSEHLISNTIKKQILTSNELLVRQALIKNTSKIDTKLKALYESLLNDKSYITIENALYKLFLNFPEDRNLYLDKTSTTIGFPDKNVRLLWLTLALVTENYNSLKTKEYYDELGSYTGKEYSPETRETAFQYLYQTFGFTDFHLKNLLQATAHHSWRFKKFARGLTDELLKDEDYKNRFKAMLPNLNEEENHYIKSKLN